METTDWLSTTFTPEATASLSDDFSHGRSPHRYSGDRNAGPEWSNIFMAVILWIIFVVALIGNLLVLVFGFSSRAQVCILFFEARF